MILTDDEKAAICTLAGVKSMEILKMNWGLKTRGAGRNGQRYKLLLMLLTIRLLKGSIEKTCCKAGYMDVLVMADEIMKGIKDDDE